MTRVAMGDVWDEARAFVVREAALLVPLALATLGLALLLFGMVTPEPQGTTVVVGPWMFVLIPCGLLMLYGNLAISTLVLVPQSSVGDACRRAFARLGRAIGVMVVLGAFVLALSLLLGLLSVFALMVGQGVLGNSIAAVVLLAVTAWAGIRLVPLVPLLAIEPPRGPLLGAVRDALALSRGNGVRIGGVLVLYFVASIVISTALGMAIGSLILLATRALGGAEAGVLLRELLYAGVTSLLQAAMTVFLAVLTRRLLAAQKS